MRLMDENYMFTPVWDTNEAIHYKAGRQRIAQELLLEILGLDPNIFLTMMKEAKEESVDGKA